MKIIETFYLTIQQKKEIYTLWNKEYPKNITFLEFTDFELYLKDLHKQHHLLLLNEFNTIKGWYFDFERDNEKWFAMILSSTVQGKGFGTSLLNRVKKTTSELNGWVIDHQNYKKRNKTTYNSPIPFYIKNNFNILPKIRLETAKISAVKIKWNA